MPGLGKNANARAARRLRAALPWLAVLVLAPATVAVGAALGGRAYVITSTLVVAYAMVPFFAQFERRKPQARELALFAAMVALAIASRAAFAFVPNFKPMAAVVIITGIAFGPSSGFLCGALSMLVSNFMFGQGPWTVFQMLSYGCCGLFFGFLADRGIVRRGTWSARQRLAVSAAGFAFYLLIAGPILDTSSVFWMLSSITPESLAAIYLAGAPVNFAQAVATFMTLLLVGSAILSKLSRVRIKYGLMMR